MLTLDRMTALEFARDHGALTESLVTVSVDATLAQAMQTLATKGISSVPVTAQEVGVHGAAVVCVLLSPA
jgi:CBS domain-containing protein